MGIPAKFIKLQDSKEGQDFSPSAYGVYNIVLNSKLLSYHYEIETKLRKLIEEHQKSNNELEVFLTTFHGSIN